MYQRDISESKKTFGIMPVLKNLGKIFFDPFPLAPNMKLRRPDVIPLLIFCREKEAIKFFSAICV